MYCRPPCEAMEPTELATPPCFYCEEPAAAAVLEVAAAPTPSKKSAKAED